MEDFGGAAPLSRSEPGEIAEVPQDPTSLVVETKDGDPRGLLEMWGDEAWVYATVDSLRDL